MRSFTASTAPAVTDCVNGPAFPFVEPWQLAQVFGNQADAACARGDSLRDAARTEVVLVDSLAA